MTRILLDANLSPQTANYLSETLGVDAIHLRSLVSGSPGDDEVVALAKSESRTIVTFDQDFGDIYFLREHGRIGVIVLRIRSQTVESVNQALGVFLTQHAPDIDLTLSLVVIEDHQVRVVSAP